MAKKKAKRAAPVKPERTASRQGKTARPERRTLQIDKLGKVITWEVPTAPYVSEPELRAAFVGGFETRVHQVNHDTMDAGIPERFPEKSKNQQAFVDGYNAAATIDGLSRQAKTLAGSSSKR